MRRLFRLTERPWKLGFARVPRVRVDGDHVQIDHFRDFRYHRDGSHEDSYARRSFMISHVRHVDFIVVPFQGASHLAHTMMSFGFDDGSQLVVSVEARLRESQHYSIWKGLLWSYPIMYVIADERDAIGHRTEFRGDDVYLYGVHATDEEVRQFLRNVLERAERLAERPERYHTVLNNCATNIRDHVNSIWPGRVPWGWGVLFSGRADCFAYRLGFLKSDETFETTRQRARINDLAAGHWLNDQFSELIRSNRV
ncbi:MAG: DUF4105 domain-containing protein [Pirellulaceae bacterium]|nr:DUF4105 domain-containing protein [Pirellulaceae bacterium]